VFAHQGEGPAKTVGIGHVCEAVAVNQLTLDFHLENKM
jgi:hypothetical protein